MHNEQAIKDEDKHNKERFTIIVNARKREFEKPKITFDEIVILAFGAISTNPNIVYGVTYKNGPKENREGSLDRGMFVYVKNGMVFNVTQTDKS